MIQLQFNVNSTYDLRISLGAVCRRLENCSKYAQVLFHVYMSRGTPEQADELCQVISRILPESQYVCFCTSGNILDGELSECDITVSCTIFEDPGTRIKVLHFNLREFTIDEMTERVRHFLATHEWVRCGEFELTYSYQSSSDVCRLFSTLPDDFVIFGGGAHSYIQDDAESFILANGATRADYGAVFVMLGGPNFHIQIEKITGWLPLGKHFVVTSAERNVIKELDGQPAFDAYARYLDISNDDNFIRYVLEFPFLLKDSNNSDDNMLRAPLRCNPDGSLVMGGDIPLNSELRISYGNPDLIIAASHEKAAILAKMHPQALWIYSCQARKVFWGEAQISRETRIFPTVAPTTGFYTSGEFLRRGHNFEAHNVTVLVVALREGEVPENATELKINPPKLSEKFSINNRLISLLTAAAGEIESANAQLEHMARTDALTGQLNRGAIQNAIDDAVNSGERQMVHLLMFDLDHFKQINDTYGHAEGDEVLKRLTSLMHEQMSYRFPDGQLGRWGGEEFMMLLPHADDAQAMELAEAIRSACRECHFASHGCVTVSIGVTCARADDSTDSLCIRVDRALYQAKEQGRNRVCCL